MCMNRALPTVSAVETQLPPACPTVDPTGSTLLPRPQDDRATGASGQFRTSLAPYAPHYGCVAVPLVSAHPRLARRVASFAVPAASWLTVSDSLSSNATGTTRPYAWSATTMHTTGKHEEGRGQTALLE